MIKLETWGDWQRIDGEGNPIFIPVINLFFISGSLSTDWYRSCAAGTTTKFVQANDFYAFLYSHHQQNKKT
jgi:hypothetical protein